MRELSGKALEEIAMGESEREQHLRELASRLLFEVRQQGKRYTLTRTAEVSAPVRHENLTLEQAEELLNTWKLRGLHGG
jgi:hypothetical protein